MQFDLQVGVGTLIVARPLDAEVQSVYNMTVQVTDGTNFATTQVSSLTLPLLTSNEMIVSASEESCTCSACFLSPPALPSC